MKGLKNINVYVEGKGIIKTDIGFLDGKINFKNEVDEEIAKFNENAVVIPSFIDEHTHGANGSDNMDKEKKDLETISKSVLQEGTTMFLATTMTQSPENISDALSNIKNFMENYDGKGAEILGVHLEGPFIAPKFKGAQPLEYIEKPNVESFEKYDEISGNNIKIVSLAPEIEGAESLIKHLVKKGVVASVAHSGATYNDCEKGVEWGITNVTHTFNAQTGFHHRDIGVVGCAMLNKNVNCELICDTIHVSVPAMKVLFNNKGKDKIIFITDSMRAKYLKDGESELGGQKVFIKNGEARLADGTLAGSVLKMNDAIKNAVEKVGIPFTDAVDCATINPAKNLKIDNEVGSIKEGKRANLVILDKNTYEVLMTIKDGNVLFAK